MKSFNIGDRVRIKNPASLIAEDELDADLKEYVRQHKKDVFTVIETTGSDNNGGKLYIVVIGAEMSPAGGFYESELELVITSEWDK